MVLNLPNIIEQKEIGELREAILSYLSSNDGCGYTFKFLFNKLVLEEQRSQIGIGFTMFSDLLTEMKNAKEIYLHKRFYGRIREYYSINSLIFHVKDLHSLREEQVKIERSEIEKAKYKEESYYRRGSTLASFETCMIIIGIIILVIIGLFYLFIQFMNNI